MTRVRGVLRAGVERLGRLLGPEWHLRRLQPALLCPVYHLAREDDPEWWCDRCRVLKPAAFEGDLDTFLKWGEPVDVREMVDWARGNRPRPHGFFLSFDDGYRELHDVVAPILKRKGVPATLFVCSSLIDNRAIFFEDHIGLILDALSRSSAKRRENADRILSEYSVDSAGLFRLRTPRHELLGRLSELLEIDTGEFLRTRQPYLTHGHVQKLISMGFGIGSHSVDHSLYEDLMIDEQLRQTTSSVDKIAQMFRLDYRVFAFPYGEFGVHPAFFQRLFAENSIDICFGTRGVMQDEFEPKVVQRTLCDGRQGSLRRHLGRELSAQWIRSLRRNNVVRRRSAGVSRQSPVGSCQSLAASR